LVSFCVQRRKKRKMTFLILQIAVPFIWFGLVGGISFLETPLKFRAPNITLPLGLGIGRIVFSALNKVELALAALLLLSFFFARPETKFALFFYGIITFLLILQTVWLLPALNARAAAVISESFAASSSTHFIYIAFEAIKFILLPVLGVSFMSSYLKFE
jgi:hypothetical protein